MVDSTRYGCSLKVFSYECPADSPKYDTLFALEIMKRSSGQTKACRGKAFAIDAARQQAHYQVLSAS